MLKRGIACCALAVVAGALTGPAAHAAPGDEASSAFGFAVRLEIGAPGLTASRACTGTLVRPRAVLTARDCLPSAQPGATVVARFDASTAVRAVNVAPDRDPGLSLVTLARPVRVTPAALATAAPAAGDDVVAAGFGRTADTWVPDGAHLASFTVGSATTQQVDLAPSATGGPGLCRGDSGASLTRALADGRRELVAVAAAAGQRGCLGETDTTAAVVARPVAGLTLPAATSDPYDQLTLSPTDSGTVPFAGAGFGTAVAVADFNKDGWPDIAVGAPRDGTGTNGTTPSGSVTVFPGSANGPQAGTRLLQTRFNASDEADDLFGFALATGDFNKDGFVDLAIGTPGEQVGTIKAGAIAVFNGSTSGLNTARGYDQNDIGQTDQAGDLFGKSLAAGDFNGDGFTDLAVGVPGKVISGARSGQVTVLKGGSGNMSLGWVVDQKGGGGSNEPGDLFGEAVAAGNVLGAKTGTVYADLVVGSPGESPSSDPQSGGAYVFPGASAGPVANGIGFTQTGNGGANEQGDRFGAALATGDFNKDGWADIAVGVPGEAPGSDPQSGAGVIIPGGNTTIADGFPINEPEVSGGANLNGDLFAGALATGDANGDGYADLMVGAPGRASGAGVVYTWTGRASSSSQPRSLAPRSLIQQGDVFGTPEADDRFGAAAAFGDLNRDGKADAVIGSPGEGAPGEAAAGVAITLSRVVPAS